MTELLSLSLSLSAYIDNGTSRTATKYNATIWAPCCGNKVRPLVVGLIVETEDIVLHKIQSHLLHLTNAKGERDCNYFD